MGHHTFDVADADRLERAERRYRYLSAEELLGALSPSPDDAVADLGSGTGFYTDDVAPHVGRVYAVDLQAEMHEYYREKGHPDNVKLVTSGIEELPFADGQLDAAVSTMTYHEFATAAAVAEVARVLGPGGRLVIADWAASGAGVGGPPLEERYGADEAVDALEAAGFETESVAVRPETFLVVARAA